MTYISSHLTLPFPLSATLPAMAAFRLSTYVQDGINGWKPFAYDGTASGPVTPVSLLSPPGHCLNVDDVHAYEIVPTDTRVLDGGFEAHAPLRLGVTARPQPGQTHEVTAGRVLGGWTASNDATGAVAVEAELTRSSRWVLATHGTGCKAAQLGGVTQAVPTVPGAVYEVRVDVANRRAVMASRSGTPLDSATAAAFLSFGDLNLRQMDVDGAEWSTFTFRATAAAASSTLVLQASGGNCVWFDNVHVSEVEPAAESIVTNGGFEAPQLAAVSKDTLDTLTVAKGTTVGGWTQGLGPGQVLGLDQPSAEGVQAWSLKATCAAKDTASGSITQQIATEREQYYTVTFFARGHTTEQPYVDVGTVSFGSVQVCLVETEGGLQRHAIDEWIRATKSKR